MADNHANDAGMSSGAVPSQDWRRLPWPDIPASSASAKAIMTSAGIFRAADSLLREARSDWMTIRPPGRPLVRKHIASGETARVSIDVALGVLIADTTAALVVMPPGIAVLLRDTANVRNLRTSFEEIWEASLPFGRPSLPPDQGKMLDLLTEGLDLSQIAEEPGISKNAVREYARDIRRRLGARTMMQAGALAALRGWVD